MDIRIWDRNLDFIGVIIQYSSLIWASRHIENGDCELYLPATADSISLLKKNYYMTIDGDDMICIIRRIELKTDVENGDYLIVNGVDAKSYCDQRVLYGQFRNNGLLEPYLRHLVSTSMIWTYNDERNMVKANGNALIRLGAEKGFTRKTKNKDAYLNLGDKLRSACMRYGWGFSITHIREDQILEFNLYRGTDRSSYMKFTPKYWNLSTSDYVDSLMNMGNAAVVSGAPKYGYIDRDLVGFAEGTDRFEKYVDRSSEPRIIPWSELIEYYPTQESGGGGEIVVTGNPYYPAYYIYHDLSFEIFSPFFMTWISAQYGSDATFETVDGQIICTIGTARIADLEAEEPDDTTNCLLSDLTYQILLIDEADAELAAYGETVSFTGEIIPNGTFEYGKDFKLGDLVAVENEYGISATARIVEAVNVWDDNGHSLTVKFETILVE